MRVEIPYSPHSKQLEVHTDPSRYKVIAAGRGSGKSVLLINEQIRQALLNPAVPGQEAKRSWYVAPTYKQAESIAWRLAMQYLPPELIKRRNVNKLQIELTNGHLMEFKGAEDPDSLRGVRLVWAGFDEYELIKEEAWLSVIRPMLIKSGGGAMFVGTPNPDGGVHFHDLFKKGERGDDGYRSWLFFTKDNPAIPREEIEKARREYPPDLFKREFEADFTITAGLIYDNFRHMSHVVPHYEPAQDDFVVGSVDPGLHNPCGALLVAWKKDGTGVVFKEYYEKGLLASENADKIAEMAKPYKVAYWVIDRSCTKRDPASGLTVFGKFKERLKPLLTAPNDANSVWAGIDETKKLFHLNEETRQPRLKVARNCNWFLWEISHYSRYKHKWRVEKNEEERPRKLHDHLMDCIRNMVYGKPWLRRAMTIHRPPPILGY